MSSEVDDLTDRIEDGNRAVLHYSRSRLLGTWLALSLLAILTAVALLLGLYNAREQNEDVEARTDRNTHRIVIVEGDVAVLSDDLASVEDQLIAEGLLPATAPPPSPSTPGPESPLPGTRGERGQRGEAGADGAQGPQGPEGIQGLGGAQGLSGDTGAQGAAGEPGAAGAAGEQGEAGAAGERGRRGRQGDQGQQGAPGAQGVQGPQGPVGPQGPTGPAGADGTICPGGSAPEAVELGPPSDLTILACVVG